MITEGIIQVRLSCLAEAALRAAERLSGYRREEIFGDRKYREFVDLRRYCCYAVADMAEFSSKAITDQRVADALGHLDRQNVSYYSRQREGLEKYDVGFRRDYKLFQRVMCEILDEMYFEKPENVVEDDKEDLRGRIVRFIDEPVTRDWESLSMAERKRFRDAYVSGQWDGDPSTLTWRTTLSTVEVARECLNEDDCDKRRFFDINKAMRQIPELIPAGYRADSRYGLQKVYAVRHAWAPKKEEEE